MSRAILRNDQWERIQDLLPGKSGDRGVTAVDNHRFVEALIEGFQVSSVLAD